jgi:hypothetical protein
MILKKPESLPVLKRNVKVSTNETVTIMLSTIFHELAMYADCFSAWLKRKPLAITLISISAVKMAVNTTFAQLRKTSKLPLGSCSGF